MRLRDNINDLIERDKLKSTVQEIVHCDSPQKKIKIIKEKNPNLSLDIEKMKVELGLVKKKEDDEK